MGLIKRTVKRAVRQQARKVAVTCGTCGKRYSNPLTHVCAPKSDFKQRKAAAGRRPKAEAARQRKREAAARKREAAKARRKAAAERRKAAAAERRKKAAAKRSAPARRPARPAHDYRLCRDPECPRHACKAYRDGITDCPLEHV